MSIGKQAKILSRMQIDALLNILRLNRYPERNRLITLLALRAGLRAHEIAHLKWSMLLDAEYNVASDIRLENEASKGHSGRIIPISKDLRAALLAWQKLQQPASEFVVSTERSCRTSPQAIVNMFARWYEQLGFVGCSSHSGRRTFITNAARKISLVGGSLRDVQMLAGHSSLRITQRYIDGEQEAQRKIVDLI